MIGKPGEPWTYTVTDTGDVERVITDKGTAYQVTFPADVPKHRGRPVEKDWQGALEWLVGKVSKEGGLPAGRGGQAEVSRWLADWFGERNLYPGETIIKERVRQIYDKAAKGR